MSSCKPRNAKGFSVPQETRKRKGSLLPRVSEGAWPYWRLEFGLPVSKTVRINFSHPSTNQARPCLASKIRWDRARSGWCGHRLFSISNWTFSLLGNSKCHWDCVGTSFIQRYGNDLDELWNTHHVPSFSVSWQEETAVVERKNGSSRILKVKPFLWVHFCWNQQSQIVQIKW